MQDAERRLKTAAERKRSARVPGGVARSGSMRTLSIGSASAASAGAAAGAAETLALATSAIVVSQRRLSQMPSKLTASLVPLAAEGLDDDDDGDDGDNDHASPNADSSTLSPEAAQRVADASNDVESAKHHSLELQVEMLRGKLARRNVVIEVIRRAYYHDVIIVKEELRHMRLGQPTASGSGSCHSQCQLQQQHEGVDDRLAAVPSVDLRDVLPLFAPSEAVLQVHPCEMCGGHLELVHGESKELQAARVEMTRASKGEQQMRGVVHRMRSEAKEREDVNDALQQRVKALTKENAYALEQLQAARRAERDQKASIATLRAKIQVALATQEDVDRLATECKDVKQQLLRSTHDRDVFSAANNHLKEELSEVTKALHQNKVEKAQLESDFGTTYYRLQEEVKKSKQLADDLATHQQQLESKTSLSAELQSSLKSLKDELATTLLRSEQTKRHLEDQLVDEERAREELQEQNLEFRRTNKRLVKELEAMQRDPSGALNGSAGATAAGGSSRHSSNSSSQQHPSGVSTAELKGIMRKRLDDVLIQIEWSQMRENDLLALLQRQNDAAARAVEKAKPAPVRRKLSRMPSTTVITRFVPVSADSDAAKTAASTLDGSARDSSSSSARPTSRGRVSGANAGLLSSGSGISGGNDDNDVDDVGEPDDFDDSVFERSGATLEIGEKNFEAYHQEVHRMLTEIEEGRSKSQKQQKTIVDMERKHQALVERLEEAKLTIEALTGSVNALKNRLNQDSAGAAEELEDMLRQLEDGKRDQLYEAEKTAVLRDALRSISDKVYELSDNQLLTLDIAIDFPNLNDDDRLGGPLSYDSNSNTTDSHIVPDLYRKKQELRRKVVMEKEMKKFHQMCHSRSEIVGLELHKLRDALESARDELDDAENKIDSDALQLRTHEAEIAKLRLTVEMGKNNLQKTEKALRTASEDLQNALTSGEGQRKELDALRAEHSKLQEDQRRVTLMLFEKTKAWEREISTNDRSNLKITTLEASLLAMTAARDALHTKLQDIDELTEYRRQTNRSVERNSRESTPQRFLGKASVLIACPELSVPVSPSTSLLPVTTSANQETSSATAIHRRELLELTMYPPARAGGRQIKTNHGSSRPTALSKLFLSSDGVSQKYMSPSPRHAFDDTGSSSTSSTSKATPSALFQDVQQRVRPFTSQS